MMDKDDLQFMSAGQQVKRYSMYLHHSFLVGQDKFMQAKHDAYMKKSHPTKTSNVFDRLEQDKRNRNENAIEMQKKNSETVSWDQSPSRSRSVVASSDLARSRQVSASRLGGATNTSSKQSLFASGGKKN